MRALKGLAPPRASHFGEIAVAGSRRLRSTLAAAPVLFERTHAHESILNLTNSTRSEDWSLRRDRRGSSRRLRSTLAAAPVL
jgi:hypothetical protein